ncbi:MAG: hypothetical protein ACOY3L_12615 [Pseudomonadota bacterium]
MMNRTIALVLALTLLGGLAACSSLDRSRIDTSYGQGYYHSFPGRDGHR